MINRRQFTTSLLALPAAAQIEGVPSELYKTINGVKLNLSIFRPDGHSPKDRRAAIVFFFGGGWRSGSPKQFEQQCRHLASKGMVAMAADYRVSSRHQAKVVDCIRDAKSAIRWVRSNAAKLGIDPNRIAAGGGSAGGHLAACTAVLPGLEEPSEDLAISSRSNAMVLFNPALMLAEAPEVDFKPRECSTKSSPASVSIRFWPLPITTSGRAPLPPSSSMARPIPPFPSSLPKPSPKRWPSSAAAAILPPMKGKRTASSTTAAAMANITRKPFTGPRNSSAPSVTYRAARRFSVPTLLN